MHVLVVDNFFYSLIMILFTPRTYHTVPGLRTQFVPSHQRAVMIRSQGFIPVTVEVIGLQVKKVNLSMKD